MPPSQGTLQKAPQDAVRPGEPGRRVVLQDSLAEPPQLTVSDTSCSRGSLALALPSHQPPTNLKSGIVWLHAAHTRLEAPYFVQKSQSEDRNPITTSPKQPSLQRLAPTLPVSMHCRLNCNSVLRTEDGMASRPFGPGQRREVVVVSAPQTPGCPVILAVDSGATADPPYKISGFLANGRHLSSGSDGSPQRATLSRAHDSIFGKGKSPASNKRRRGS